MYGQGCLRQRGRHSGIPGYSYRYELKAVLVLLSLLSIGVKDITLGPKLPAFVSPAVLDVLVKNFDLKPNTTVDADMARMDPAR